MFRAPMDLREVADRLELRGLVDAYAVYVDAPDPAAFAALFVDDGRLVAGPGHPPWALQGTEELRTKNILFADPPPFKRTFHHVGTHLCEIDADRARGTTHVVAHHLSDDARNGEVQVSYLVYADTYVRTSGGWRFAERVISQLWSETRPAGYMTAGELATKYGSSYHAHDSDGF
jgi:hypothetical protein